MILLLILCSTFFFTLFSPAGSFAVRPIEAKVNEPARDFKLSNLTGQEISLTQLKGKPAILFFWTTWCPFCREEMSMLQNEYKKITAGGITLLAINVGEPREKAQKFFKGRNAEFPVLLDINSKVAYSYNLIGVPTFVLIDAQGKIRFQGNSFPDNYLSILK
jgi:peroxiredoxin